MCRVRGALAGWGRGGGGIFFDSVEGDRWGLFGVWSACSVSTKAGRHTSGAGGIPSRTLWSRRSKTSKLRRTKGVDFAENTYDTDAN